MQDRVNYFQFDRGDWGNFSADDHVELTQDNLNQIKALNDRISLNDVSEVYLPLVKLIKLQYQQYLKWQDQKAAFLKMPARRVPFIIGIAGSVAVGKSTTARLLSLLLNRLMPQRNVELITTDGFLYPTAELKRRGILNRKGFPESYDMEALLTFLNDVKAGVDVVESPVYSHATYDCAAGCFDRGGD